MNGEPAGNGKEISLVSDHNKGYLSGEKVPEFKKLGNVGTA
jgi:hypothetical protein